MKTVLPFIWLLFWGGNTSGNCADASSLLTVNQSLGQTNFDVSFPRRHLTSTESTIGQQTESWVQIIWPDKTKAQSQDSDEFLKVLNKSRDLARLIAMPSGLTVILGELNNFDTNTNTIIFESQRTNSAGTALLDLKYRNAILVHEYGHAVFDLAMFNSFEPWKDLVQKNASKNAEIIQERIRKSEQNLPLDGPRIDWVEVAKTHSDLKLAYDLATIEFRMVAIAQAYSEFFGDVFAAIYSEDPRIIEQALYNPNSEAQKLRLVSGRNFAHKFTDAELNVWKNDLTWSEGFPYLLLMPSRHALWEKFLSITTTNSQPQDPKKFLKSVFDVLSQSLSRILLEEVDPETIDPSKINEELCFALQHI